MGERALALCGAALVLCLAPATAAADELTAVQANVGNVNTPGCQDQLFKLCQRPVERRTATALRALRADIVGFEEILPPELCLRAPSSNSSNLCSGPLDPPSQVSRLIGSAADQACDSRLHWDCVAAPGPSLRIDRLATRPVQAGCEDRGFTLNTGTARLRGWPITVAVAHPDSTDIPCRAQQLRDLFASLPAAGPVLILGDFNLDPFRDDDASVREWRSWVPSRFRQLNDSTLSSLPCGSSQLDPNGDSLDAPLAPCTGPLSAKTIDHVLVRGLSGGCEVRRVDGGGGMDHRAQVCRIQVGSEVTPGVGISSKRCTVSARFSPAPPHLTAVRFRFGKRYVVDRKAPFSFRRRAKGRGRPGRLAMRPVLANGDGPRINRRLKSCSVRRR